MNRVGRSCLLLLAILAAGCDRVDRSRPSTPPWMPEVRALAAAGNYRQALALLEDQTSRVPPPPFAGEALYLQGYLQAYGLSDFRRARGPLQALVDSDPRHRLGAFAMRLLGDCFYFDGLYEPARRQYRALLETHGASGHGAYALYQTGNCWFQEDDPGKALTSWREAVDGFPKDPWAVRSQLQVANVYVKLDDPQMAIPELERLSSMTTDPVVRSTVQESLRKLGGASPRTGSR
jgi:tetratricopeptide (TPR) repeat protein